MIERVAKSEIQVSIVIATYQPVYHKFLSTVQSILNQKDIIFEIIITDDGSETDYFSEIKNYFIENNFDSYQFLKHDTNLGTVKNVLDGILISQGQYVYLTSPGDLIYDRYTMRDYYYFAESHNAKICFGDYVNYSANNHKICTNTDDLAPTVTSVYSEKFQKYKTSFVLGNNVLGACYFRERLYAIDSINYISHASKYTEDYTSTLYGLANNIPVYYFQRKITWYECDSGISKQGGVWAKRIKEDVWNTYKTIITQYKNDRIIDAGYIKHMPRKNNTEKLKLFSLLLIKHPIISLRYLRINHYPKRIVDMSPSDFMYLQQLLDNARGEEHENSKI